HSLPEEGDPRPPEVARDPGRDLLQILVRREEDEEPSSRPQAEVADEIRDVGEEPGTGGGLVPEGGRVGGDREQHSPVVEGPRGAERLDGAPGLSRVRTRSAPQKVEPEVPLGRLEGSTEAVRRGDEGRRPESGEELRPEERVRQEDPPDALEPARAEG